MSVQLSVSAMARDTLYTLGDVKIPRANKSAIILLLQQQGENETIASRNEPMAKKGLKK